MTNNDRHIVIVGGVAGGASAATRARRMNGRARITIFEKDSHASFANCGLPYYIGGEIEERDSLLVAKPELLRGRFNLDLRTRHEVLSIDRASKRIRVLNRDTQTTFDQPYDKLILAPGASPIVPPMNGADARNVFTLRNLEDTDRIKQHVQRTGQNGRAVVIGAGFIGLEMVEQLHRVGMQVSLIELQPQVLPLLDVEMAHVIEAELRKHDVALHLGTSVETLECRDSNAVAAILKDGTRIDANLFIVGIGVKPNAQLAQSAGLAIGATGGVTINEYAQTSDPDIYAVGDVAEYVYQPTGKPMRVPLAGPANRAGRIAGEHAATDRSGSKLAPVLGTSIVRVFDVAAGMTGMGEKLAARLQQNVRSVYVAANHHAGYYPGAKQMILKLIFDPSSRKVLGAQIAGIEGVDKRLDVIAAALALGATVDQLAGLDLAYAPPFGSAKDPVHMAAFTAINALDGVVQFLPPASDLAGLQIVDVRSKSETASGMIAGATHIPVDQLRARLGELDASKPTVTICATGLRSYIAARILTQNGFANVSDLAGGMLMRRHAKPNETLTRA